MRLFRPFILLLFACVCQPAAADTELTPHSAEYKLKMSVLSGRLNTRLAVTERGYEATHHIEPKGMAKLFAGGEIHEVSGFETRPDGVFPVHYRSMDTLTKDETDADVDFDWSTGAMTGVVNGVVLDDRLENLVHDRVSIQYQLMFDLLSGGPGQTYVLYDIDEFKTLTVRNIGEKKVRVPAGRFDAVGIQHQAEGSSRTTTLWCVPELDFLPVIIEQHRKGKLRMRAQLTEYSPEPVTEVEVNVAEEDAG